MSRVLVAGCGYVGSRLAELLVSDGSRVWGLKRHPDGLPDGVVPVRGDVTDPDSLAGLPEGLDAVVYAVAPSGRTEGAYRAAYVDGLRNVLDALGARPAGRRPADQRYAETEPAATGPSGPRVLLVSSTGVYGQEDGSWVDEETPEQPADATAEVILEGEAVARERGAPGVVLRLGGIYGPGRDRTVRLVTGGDAPCMAPDLYGNRIHRDDAAGALRHLLSLEDPAPVYLGVDREPAPLREVYAWIAERAGVADPCRDAGPADVVAEGRRGTNKRCSSRRLVGSGYQLLYPTFREGYGPMVDELSG